jgi:hypothetical protein
MKKPTISEKKAGPERDNSITAQRVLLLQELRKGPVTTYQARQELDIYYPPARVHELRWGEGHNIATKWEIVATAEGNKHRVGVYALLPGKWEGFKNENVL